MDGINYRRAGSEDLPGGLTDHGDEHLLHLCAAFIGRAEARTTEGHRLDDLPWTREVDAGYRELNRGVQDHRAMLAQILEAKPGTLRGLVAKAHVISRHQEDCDADPIAARILAEDVLRVCSAGLGEK